MNPKNERRREAARHRWTQPVGRRQLADYVEDNGEEIPTEFSFKGKDGNPLSYSQLTPTQKLTKLEMDVACNKSLRPYVLTEHSINIPDGYKIGDTWTPCQKQRKRLQGLITAESKPKIEKKVEKAPAVTEEKVPECPTCHGKGTYFDKESGSKKLCPVLESNPELHTNPEMRLAKWNRRYRG